MDDAAQRLESRLNPVYHSVRRPDAQGLITAPFTQNSVHPLCKELTKTPKGDLGECLRLIKTKKHLHPAFEQSLIKLYAYTSDDGGIRHALTEEHEHPKFADAKFMLVTCSALVNYLRTVMTGK